jgi:hypothetical protein
LNQESEATAISELGSLVVKDLIPFKVIEDADACEAKG